MKNFLLVVVACVATLGANAQTKSVQLIGSGGRLAILEGPSGSGSPLLFSLPTTGGTLLVENSSAAVTFGSLTLSNAINQLTFGSGNTILITAPAPSSSRTYTLPDVGANASFVMTEGTQTINGAKTFTTVPVLGSLTGVLRASSGVVGIDTELTALSLLGTTGHIVRTGANTYASRTILGTNFAIDVTNGSGVGGNPTLDLSDSLDFTGKKINGGTFYNSTLESPTINNATLTNTTINNPNVDNANIDSANITNSTIDSSTINNSTLNNVNFTGVIGTNLTPSSNVRTDASGNLTVGNINAATELTGVTPVANGGTGTSATPSNGQVLIGNGSGYTVANITGTSPITVTNGAGTIAIGFNGETLPTSATVNSTLRWNGSDWVANAGVLADGSNNLNVTGGLDVDGTATIGALNGVVKATAGVLSAGQVNLTSEVTGVLPIANGGTGISITPTANQILVGNGAGYSLKTLTAGTGISIVDGGATLTINNTSQIIPAGTVTNATLVWNGTSWVENTNVTMVPATGNTVVGGSFDVNGNVELGDAVTDVVTITAGTITGAGANKFADRVQITGDGTTVTFTINNTTVVGGSVIVVTLEDGSDTNNYLATVSAKSTGASFNVRLSGPMAVGATKWVNYTIINP